VIKTTVAGEALTRALEKQQRWVDAHPLPPNREIVEGEPCCARCGSGRSTHENGTRNHRFQLRMAKARLRSELR